MRLRLNEPIVNSWRERESQNSTYWVVQFLEAVLAACSVKVYLAVTTSCSSRESDRQLSPSAASVTAHESVFHLYHMQFSLCALISALLEFLRWPIKVSTASATPVGITTDLYYVPDTVRPIYFVSDREDSQA